MKGNRMVVVFASVLVLSCFSSSSFTANTGMHLTENKEAASVSKKALLEDIDYFVAKIEKAHADPYRLISREDFLMIVSDIKDYVRTHPRDELSFIECFYVLQELAAAIFKHSRMGAVIGQETAGRIKFNSDPVTVKLPKSGLEAHMPVAIYALPGDNPDRGVIPDIIIDYSLGDLKENLDREMERVKELIVRE